MAHTHRLLIAIFIVGLFAPSVRVTAQDDAPADLKVSKSLAKRLVKDLVSTNEKRIAAARRMLLRTRPEDRRHVFAALEARKTKPPKRKNRKERVIHETLPLTESERKDGEFLIHLPKKYNGKKAYPLLYRLHGSGSEASQYAELWQSCPMADRFIAVTPTIPSPDRMAWMQPGGAQLLDRIYTHMLRKYHIDTDRVYLAGYSAGGGAAFYFAQVWPERFAAIFSRSRVYPKSQSHWDGCMAVMQWIPGFYLVGLADKEDRVAGYRQVEAYWKKHEYPGEFRFVEGRGHEYMAEFDKEGLGYLLKHRRKNYPKAFHAMYYAFSNSPKPDLERNKEQYWLRVDKFNVRGAPVEVRAEGNVIHVTGAVQAGSLLLNDHIVDLDQPVTIRVNGKDAWSGQVERSVAFLLDGHDRVPDPKRLFWNKVPFASNKAPSSGSDLGRIRPKSELGKIKPSSDTSPDAGE